MAWGSAFETDPPLRLVLPALRCERAVGMLVGETVRRIRRKHSRKSKSVKEIARDLAMPRNNSARFLRAGETGFFYEGEVRPRPKLGWRERSNRRTHTPITAQPT